MGVQIPKQAKVGDSFSIAVDLLATTPLRAGAFELGYDETRLKLVKVEEGEVFRKIARGSSFNYTIQEEVGRVSVSYAPTEVVSGSQNLAKLTFEVIGPGTGTARFVVSNASGEDAAGRAFEMASPEPSVMSLSR